MQGKQFAEEAVSSPRLSLLPEAKEGSSSAAVRSRCSILAFLITQLSFQISSFLSNSKISFAFQSSGRFFLVCFQHAHRVEDPLGHSVPGRLRARVKISKPLKPRLWRTGDLQCEEHLWNLKEVPWFTVVTPNDMGGTSEVWGCGLTWSPCFECVQPRVPCLILRHTQKWDLRSELNKGEHGW